MTRILGAVLIVSTIGPAAAETYSTVSQFDIVRNYATHEAAENIILNGEVLSAGVERGTHSFAIAFENHIYNCVTPWESFSHCRSETSTPIFDIRK